MAPKKSQTLFPAGEPDLRLARLRCAIACQNYNNQPENTDPDQRVSLWLDIVQPSNSSSGRLTTEPLGANQSQRRKVPPPHASVVPTAQPLPLHVSTADDSAATFRSFVSPTTLDFDARLGRGSPPEIHLQPSLDISKSPSLAIIVNGVISQPDSNTGLPKKGFPGQGHAPYLKPQVHIDYGTRLEIAPSTFINRDCKILDTPVRTVKIGERCLIGPDFHVYAVSHPLDYRERKGPADAPSYALDVTVEDDCWIGGRVTILGGVTVGRGCVIGANSLVTKDIPAYHLAYGSPARVIRKISGPRAGSSDHPWYLCSMSELSAWVVAIGNRPLRTRDVFVVVCGIGLIWTCLKIMLFG